MSSIRKIASSKDGQIIGCKFTKFSMHTITFGTGMVRQGYQFLVFVIGNPREKSGSFLEAGTPSIQGVR